MTKTVEIEALKSFNKTPQGELCDVGERFHVDETRADELQRLGLAERAKGAPKPQEPGVPETQKAVAPAPATKGGRKPLAGV